MKKKIFAMALAAVTLMSFNAGAAQADDNNCKGECAAAQCDKNKKDCKDRKDCNKKDCKDRKECKDRKDGKRACGFNPFEDLNLTADQQTRLKAITPPGQVIKEGVKRGLDRGINPMDFARSVYTDYMKQVKGVLSPEQYVQFLENAYVSNGVRKADKKSDFKGDKKKGNKNGSKKFGKGMADGKRLGRDAGNAAR